MRAAPARPNAFLTTGRHPSMSGRPALVCGKARERAWKPLSLQGGPFADPCSDSTNRCSSTFWANAAGALIFAIFSFLLFSGRGWSGLHGRYLSGLAAGLSLVWNPGSLVVLICSNLPPLVLSLVIAVSFSVLKLVQTAGPLMLRILSAVLRRDTPSGLVEN
jgi:hypothetical protein